MLAPPGLSALDPALSLYPKSRVSSYPDSPPRPEGLTTLRSRVATRQVRTR